MEGAWADVFGGLLLRVGHVRNQTQFAQGGLCVVGKIQEQF